MLFERDSRVGGRIESVEVASGVSVELGAAIAIRQNRLLVHFAELLQLQTKGPTYVNEEMGILSTDREKGMLFSTPWTGSLNFLNKIQALWRYVMYWLGMVQPKSETRNAISVY